MSNESITIRVANKYLPPSEEVQFKIRPSTPLKKVFVAYKSRIGSESNNSTFYFTFNDKRISEDDTAQQLQIEDGGQIDCVLPTNSEIVSAKLLDICNSDELTLDALQERINSLEPSTIHDACNEKSPHLYTFFHRACLNKRITLDIISYLLEIFPEAVSSFVKSPSRQGPLSITYPLHLACFNRHCPSSVIELLVKRNPELCKVKSNFTLDYLFAPARLPVCYYLSRNVNVDIGTVKLFVNAEEQGTGYYPIHSLLSNSNINKMQDILEYLVNAEPSSLLETDQGRLPLNIACGNKAVNLAIMEFLFNSIPEGSDLIDGHNKHPIHDLCGNKMLDDDVSLEILRFMLDIDPTLPQMRDTIKIPIHYAVGHGNKSLEFCKVLIDAYPESLKIEALFNGSLPIHEACGHGDGFWRVDTVDTIQYMLDLYPDIINARDSQRDLPIHHAANLGNAKTIELLLKHDPDAASKMTIESEDSIKQLPLHIAIRAAEHHNAIDGIISNDLKAVQVLYDAYPEAINIRDGDGDTPLDIARGEGMNREDIVDFLQMQVAYAQQAQDTTALSTPDEEGYLPLHRALLQGNASLGSIKLLVRGNTEALQLADQKGVLPLHTACRKATADIVKFLVDSYNNGLDVCDINQDYPLHYACRAANLDVIKYLMRRSTSRVSTTNNDNKLPFHLLIESDNDVSSCSLFYRSIRTQDMHKM